jgi:hypothetical protein
MSEQDQKATDDAIAVFLANGGVIQKIESGKSGRVDGASYSQWSKKKPSTSPLANPPEED